jgi:hypothetical protein
VQRKNGASQLGARHENAAQTAFLRGSFCCGVSVGRDFCEHHLYRFYHLFSVTLRKMSQIENTTFPPFSPFFSHVSKNVSGLGTPLLPPFNGIFS